ncbi:MAG: hypothetical protein HQ579_01735, partial [Candidatus Omnitrophica bacterium]|nr:hypothetical protein [Candidatus Omnitrophota bacterium]
MLGKRYKKGSFLLGIVRTKWVRTFFVVLLSCLLCANNVAFASVFEDDYDEYDEYAELAGLEEYEEAGLEELGPEEEEAELEESGL